MAEVFVVGAVATVAATAVRAVFLYARQVHAVRVFERMSAERPNDVAGLAEVLRALSGRPPPVE